VIATTTVDPTLGVGNVPKANVRNSANILGHGIDIAIQTKNLIGAFQWTTSFNFNYVKSIITKYFFNFVETPVSGSTYREGLLATGLYSYRFIGLDPVTGDPLGYLDGHVSKDYQAIIRDSFQHQVYHGSSEPLYYGNILNSFSWKGFSVSVNLTYRLAFYFRRKTINYSSLFTGWSGHSDYALRWQQSGDEVWTSIPSMIYPANSNRDQFYAGSETMVERGDNIRLTNIRFGFPSWENKRWKKFPVKSLEFFFTPSNLNILIWKANKSGLDPDFSGGGGFIFPSPPVWATGLTVHF
jgi:hypothetical protein